LRQTPNQPLFNGLKEDALISYTLFQYKKDGDYSWPLLFPMVKSAVRAMDAIQEFSKKELHTDIALFTVSGGSKRGWTTWLTGAEDKRVEAIAPAVIDVLNMPVNLDYQLETWGAYSPQIQDYVDLGIPQDVHTQQGQAITTMIDPYSYRQKLTMPKLILLGTNDPYWPVDAIKNYYNDIPGENFILYVPNAGHDLDGGEKALQTLSAFFDNTLNHRIYPACSWNVHVTVEGVDLYVRGTGGQLIKAYLWAANSDDRDFRDEHWSASGLPTSPDGTVSTTIAFPDSGYKAFYIDLEYPDNYGGTYVKSTRMFVTDDDELL
jgi:PhoPQ-activated pathogenicity-related protein